MIQPSKECDTLIELDILFVTFRSERWVEECIASIVRSEYDLSKVGLYFVDNSSDDGTISLLNKVASEYSNVFREIQIQQLTENRGFGTANNIGARLSYAPFLFCLNIDTKVYPDTLKRISDIIEQDKHTNVGVWELRQYPYEHPKIYDPLTGETSWVSGSAFVVQRKVFECVDGFDENIFMYGEDVDFSWRVRAKGYKLRYVPCAVVDHFCYPKKEEIKPNQFAYSIIYNQFLRAKFGTKVDRLEGYIWLILQLIKGAHFSGSRYLLLKTLMKHRYTIWNQTKWRENNLKGNKKQIYSFYGFEYELMREGSFVACGRPTRTPKVSILVRTCGRPAVLRETLLSLRAQTYPNLEVVIVEDGANVSEQMIRSDFSDLNYIYQATGEKRGRCVSGNIALSLATGDYFNFLDDDDLFFADHVETLVYALEQNPHYRVAYGMGFETPIDVLSKEPYRYRVMGISTIHSAAFDTERILRYNIAPIQAIMFDRDTYEVCGGFDENLNVLEDWDLWIRYALHTPFLFVPKTTSIYRVPADKAEKAKRQAALDSAVEIVRSKYACNKQKVQSLKSLLYKHLNRNILLCIKYIVHVPRKTKRWIHRRMGRTM